MIFLAMTLELRMILPNICRRVIDSLLINTFLPYVFPLMLSPQRFHQIFRLLLTSANFNGSRGNLNSAYG